MRHLVAVLLGALILCPTIALGQVDVRSTAANIRTTFSLANIKLGMTPAEVMTTWGAHLSPIDHTTTMPCVSEQLAQMRTSPGTPQTQSCMTEMYLIHPQSYQVSVYLIEDVPANPGVTHVYRVIYQQYIKTKADNDALARSVLAKYGPPAVGSVTSATTGATWCNRHSLAQHCEPDVLGSFPDVALAFNIALGNLDLNDFQYEARQKAAIDRLIQASRSGSKVGI